METQLKKSTVALIVLVSVLLLGIVIGNRLTFAIDNSDAAPLTLEETSEVMPVQEQEKKPPVRAVGDVKPPKLIKKVDPVYPEDARKEGIEGAVIIEATTDIYGRVVDTKVLRSVPELDKAAMDAIKQWVYEPIIIDGEPNGVIFTVTCVFKLKDKAEKDKADAEKEKSEKPPVRATGEIKPPKLIKKVDPVYPEDARKEGIEGAVIIEATTDIYGRVVKTKVLRSVPELDEAAMDAVKQWIYEPIIIKGEPNGVIFTVTLTFKLKEKKKK